MARLQQDLIARIAQRAQDPRRRYLLAAEDESGVALSMSEIERKLDQSNSHAAEALQLVLKQMKHRGLNLPRMTLVDRADGVISASSQARGAKPLAPPPAKADWQELETIMGRAVPEELKELYTIADGGFGPGARGLYPVRQIASAYQDLRRRGPDYCGTIDYPQGFLPIAEEKLQYHYCVETGHIVTSNQDWENDGLPATQIFEVAFPTLADMMKAWLAS